jgi:hypothetical protein
MDLVSMVAGFWMVEVARLVVPGFVCDGLQADRRSMAANSLDRIFMAVLYVKEQPVA